MKKRSLASGWHFSGLSLPSVCVLDKLDSACVSYEDQVPANNTAIRCKFLHVRDTLYIHDASYRERHRAHDCFATWTGLQI